MRSVARVSSRSRVSRVMVNRCKAAAARASASRNAGSAAAARRVGLGGSAGPPPGGAPEPHRRALGLLGLGELGIGGDPAQMKQRRLGLAHALGDGAVTDRLPRLAFERVDLAR